MNMADERDFKIREKQENKITRVEVIDENGRSYVNWDKSNKVEIQIQDNGRTLKVFIAKTR